MPTFEDAQITPEQPQEPEQSPEGETEELTPRERRRLQREIKRGGSKGSTWTRGAHPLSYTPPEEARRSFEFLPASSLVVDPRYNRPIQQRWVEQIAAAFNPDQLEALAISRRLYRGKGKDERQVFDGDAATANRVEHVVIAGQHRLLATLKAKGPDYLLPCIVYDKLTERQEAALFALLDEKKRPHQPWMRFRAHLFAQDEPEVSIERIVSEAGLEVYLGDSGGTQDGIIYAVSTLTDIYQRNGGDFLRRVLDIHYGAWQTMADAYTMPMIAGTTLLLRRFSGYSQWRDEWLMQALTDPTHNPISIRQRAQGAALGSAGTSIAQEVARLEHRYYQQGRKGYQRLPEWNATTREILARSDAATKSRYTGSTPPTKGARKEEVEGRDA
jgi:hypothetical protein